MSHRVSSEEFILQCAEILGIIDIYPHIHTSLGIISIIDSTGNLIEEKNSDWIIKGSINNLSDQDFLLIEQASNNFIMSMLSSVISK